MIARKSLDLFDPVLALLPRLVPSDALVPDDAAPAQDGPFLDPAAHPPDPAAAAIVAVIDHAIPFAHPLLTTATGHSRVAAIWLMEAQATERRLDIAFGRELRGPQIDALRCPSAPDAAYRACGLMEPGRCMGMAGASSHGAAVVALAAGHDPRAPEARRHPVLAVSLPRIALSETSGSLAALFIQAAVIFVIARARRLAREMSRQAGCKLRPPLVVNLSLGVTAGADDGSALLTQLQDAISAQGPTGDLGPVHFVLPTGNNRQDRLRAVLRPGQSIGWQIPPADPTPNAIEIWAAPGAPAPRLAIETPDGVRLEVPLSATGAGRICDGRGEALARVVLQRRGGAPGRFCLTVILPPSLPAGAGDPSAPPGLWRLHLLGESGASCDLAVHRDDRLPGFRGQGRQSRLFEPGHQPRTEDGSWPGPDPEGHEGAIRHNGTASAYARGSRQIRVGASLAHPVGRLGAYCGLLPDGAPGDVTAPADRSAARSGMILPGITGTQRQRLSGTSLSAPQVTRWLAAQLSEGADIPDREGLRRVLSARCTTRGRDEACEGVPDLGPPDLPWRDGL